MNKVGIVIRVGIVINVIDVVISCFIKLVV